MRWRACSAITGTDWIADEPVPITPTRWPVKSTASMRPIAGVIDLPLKSVEPLDIGHSRIRQATGGEHDEFRRHRLAVGGRHRPAVGAFVEDHAIDPRVELDIAAAGRNGRRHGWRSAGFPAAAQSARSSPIPAATRRRTNTNTACSRCRSARRDSGSSTRCRRRRRPARKPVPKIPARAAGAACTCRQIPRRPRQRRRSRGPRQGSCRRRIAGGHRYDTPSDFAAIARQHSTRGVKAQEPKRRFRAHMCGCVCSYRRFKSPLSGAWLPLGIRAPMR